MYLQKSRFKLLILLVFVISVTATAVVANAGPAPECYGCCWIPPNFDCTGGWGNTILSGEVVVNVSRTLILDVYLYQYVIKTQVRSRHGS